jgi:hypothetical protein
MLRGGAVILADVREPTIGVVCEPRGNRGRYNMERLIAEHGADAKRIDLLNALVDSPVSRSVSNSRPSAHSWACPIAASCTRAFTLRSHRFQPTGILWVMAEPFCDASAIHVLY